jgi:hypothetical protein
MRYAVHYRHTAGVEVYATLPEAVRAVHDVYRNAEFDRDCDPERGETMAFWADEDDADSEMPTAGRIHPRYETGSL